MENWEICSGKSIRPLVTARPLVNEKAAALPDASTLAEATDIITEAIQRQLSSLLVVSKDDIDPKKPIHKYGVDSLVAVEMRNWFSKGAGADVETAEILGDVGITDLTNKVARKSQFVKEELKG
ncbi:hypothetical protein BCR34DRAFT_608431 [Clohesyomyces aquaticus]|uniref:Carrier domain-containing protein n=1 Tax=Clohesyomyces aquaticus TaxID=1231657 RepID=A0A1Y1Y7G0_9PLEO|nr:hypothetical protein BCR34DRAFT_608431 [Clohesyomyces aquaticus]